MRSFKSDKQASESGQASTYGQTRSYVPASSYEQASTYDDTDVIPELMFNDNDFNPIDPFGEGEEAVVVPMSVLRKKQDTKDLLRKKRKEVNAFFELPEVRLTGISMDMIPHSYFRNPHHIRITNADKEMTEKSRKDGLYCTRQGGLKMSEGCEGTCNNPFCNGHNAIIEFHKDVKILHPEAINRLINIAKSVCHGCYNLYLSDAEIKAIKRVKVETDHILSAIALKSTKLQCPHKKTDECSQKRTFIHKQSAMSGNLQYRIGNQQSVQQMSGNLVYNFLCQLSPYTINALGFDNEEHITSLVLVGINVSPPTSRPIIILDGGKPKVAEETKFLSDIVSANNALTARLGEGGGMLAARGIGKPSKQEIQLKLVKTKAEISAKTASLDAIIKKIEDKKNKGIITELKGQRNELDKEIYRLNTGITILENELKTADAKPTKVVNEKIKRTTNKSYIDLTTDLYNACKAYFKYIKTSKLQGKKCALRMGQGKDADSSARAVASPGGDLELCEIEISSFLNKLLVRRETVTVTNQSYFNELLYNGGILNIIDREGNIIVVNEYFLLESRRTLQLGEKITRRLRDGDIVVVVRNPSLHRGNMYAFFARITPSSRVARAHLAVTSAYNLDFDGDELFICVPQMEKTINEIKRTMFVGRQILSPKAGTPIMAFVYNALVGWFRATKNNDEINPEIWQETYINLKNRGQLSTFIDRLRRYNLTKTIIDIDSDTWYKIYNRIQDISIIVKVLNGYGIIVDDIPNPDAWDEIYKDLFYRGKLESFVEILRNHQLIDATDNITREIPIMTGRTLFSMLLPEDFDYPATSDTPYHSVLIRSGIMLSGTLDNKHLGKGSPNTIVHTLAMSYGMQITSNFITDGYNAAYMYLDYNPVTIGIEDCDYANRIIYYDVETNEVVSDQQLRDHKSGKIRIVTTDVAKDKEEFKDKSKYLIVYKRKAVDNITSKVRNAEKEILKLGEPPKDPKLAYFYDNAVTNIMTGFGNIGSAAFRNTIRLYENNLADMASGFGSGAKGDESTISSIGGCIGIQQISGANLHPTLAGNTRCLSTQRPGESLESKGIIESNYMKGMTPNEYVIAAASQRKGLMDTATTTSITGNLNRLLTRATDGVGVIAGAVVSPEGNIYQYSYGGDGFIPERLMKVNGKYTFVNVAQEVSKINYKYGWVRDVNVEKIEASSMPIRGMIETKPTVLLTKHTRFGKTDQGTYITPEPEFKYERRKEYEDVWL